MPTFLLECLSEEIPSSAQVYAEEVLKSAFESELKLHSIPYNSIKTLVAPRRISISVSGLPLQIKTEIVEIKGPKVSSNSDIITNFLKRLQQTPEALYIKKIKSEEFYFLNLPKQEQQISDLLTDITGKVLKNWQWPKAMRWHASGVKWVRPLKSLVCMLDNLVLPIKFANLIASSTTEGHRFKTSRATIELKTAGDYEGTLEKYFVIVDQIKRRNIIRSLLLELSEQNNLLINVEEESIQNLIIEVAGLVEWPYSLLGSIDNEFMELPSQVIEITMKVHQRYFPLYTLEGKIASKFIIISNFVNPSKVIKEKIIYGNEKVLKARLADARFLIKQDLTVPLIQAINKLDKIIFHKNLGSVLDKTKRITELAKYIAFWVPHAQIEQVEEVAKLVKFDLATGLVREFPELQGIAGSYYAEKFLCDSYISQAILEHYYPLSSHSVCSKNPIAVTIALADKIDNLMGLMAVGEKVTGARDPYALRRNALGIIRTLIENNINLPLEVVLHKSASLFSITVFHSSHLKKIKGSESISIKNQLVQKIFNFCLERLKSLLKLNLISENIIEALYITGDPLKTWLDALILKDFVQSEVGSAVFSAYKRVANIIKKSSSIDSLNDKSFSTKLIEQNEEIILAEKIREIETQFKEYDKKDNKPIELNLKLNLINTLVSPLNNFMDKVMVNTSDPAVKLNRIALLTAVHKIFNKGCNFDKIYNVN